ncbi:MAG: hypothetical protein R6U51_05550 [Anaerolineales bacterium]
MITVDVTFYGDIARFAGGSHVASQDVLLTEKATVGDLLQKLGISPDDRGYLFINAVLHDAPGLYASKEAALDDGDHIGIFSTTHMWPYQYRDGIHMSDQLQKAMKKHGSMQNVYGRTDKKRR